MSWARWSVCWFWQGYLETTRLKTLRVLGGPRPCSVFSGMSRQNQQNKQFKEIPSFASGVRTCQGTPNTLSLHWVFLSQYKIEKEK